MHDGRRLHARVARIQSQLARGREEGQSPHHRTAYADLGLFSGDKRVRFLIEMERVNSFVRLTIHDVPEAQKQGIGSRVAGKGFVDVLTKKGSKIISSILFYS